MKKRKDTKSKKQTKPTFKLEMELSADGKIIAGVDEVGRGCLAGPIVAGAVIFSKYEKVLRKLNGVADSKILTADRRVELDMLIREQAYDIGIGSASVEEIDSLGIGAANVLAFKRALDNLHKCDLALIDGRRFRGFDYDYICLEKGESKSISIAAASIIAKVFRDNLMTDLHKEFSQYFFDSNKGYGGKSHYAALEKLGPSIHHRITFLKKFENRNNQSQLF